MAPIVAEPFGKVKQWKRERLGLSPPRHHLRGIPFHFRPRHPPFNPLRQHTSVQLI
ncbi:MAG: hypothetical protein GY803_13685 [Chloroflexi bacterium]|nr:hypothetical protein [Chloroflexota bacterium]